MSQIYAYGTFASDGITPIVAFYDDAISPPPAGVDTIAITDEQHSAVLAKPGYSIVDGALVAPAALTAAGLLSAAQTEKTAALSAACNATLVAGYTSSALGSAYTYPSDYDSQRNLASITAAGAGGSLKCATSSGLWAMVAHTEEQVTKVSGDWVTFLNAQQTQYATFEAQVNASDATVASVNAITWVAASVTTAAASATGT